MPQKDNPQNCLSMELKPRKLIGETWKGVIIENFQLPYGGGYYLNLMNW